MAAPRLLDKKLVNASVAQERKQQIDSGLKLAEAVDALKEAKAKESAELEEFRVHTLAVVQAQIDAKIAENVRLNLDNKILKEERLLAQAPINLKEEWQRVKEMAEANESWQDRNTQQAIELLAKEEDVRTGSDKNSEEREEIVNEHKLSLRTLSEAEQKFVQASEALERAERQAQSILQNAQEIDNRSKVREEDATLREISLSKREEEVDAHEIDLANREIKLRSRQETFMKAQAYIKSKRK